MVRRGKETREFIIGPPPPEVDPEAPREPLRRREATPDREESAPTPRRRESPAKLPKNRMTLREAQQAASDATMSWSEWEKSARGILLCNGWTIWRDRVLPKRFGAEAQRVGRAKGLPDFIAYKFSPDGSSQLAGVECKTGRARATKEQEGWIEAFEACPGAWGMIAYPSDRALLIEKAGGVTPL